MTEETARDANNAHVLPMELEVKEQLWTAPDWKCPRCQVVNFAIRKKCRNCGGTMITDIGPPAPSTEAKTPAELPTEFVQKSALDEQQRKAAAYDRLVKWLDDSESFHAAVGAREKYPSTTSYIIRAVLEGAVRDVR